MQRNRSKIISPRTHIENAMFIEIEMFVCLFVCLFACVLLLLLVLLLLVILTNDTLAMEGSHKELLGLDFGVGGKDLSMNLPAI